MQIHNLTKVIYAICLTLTLLISGSAHAFVKSGNIDNFTFTKASISSFEGTYHAGAEATLLLQIGGLGQSDVKFSASWDWSAYNGDHPCALVEKVPHTFIANVLELPSIVPWESDAAVTITHKSGALITADITGGSVCEVAVPGANGSGSNNEWIINFEVNGGTKRFTEATGTGTIHFFFDSGVGSFGISEVLLHLD